MKQGGGKVRDFSSKELTDDTLTNIQIMASHLNKEEQTQVFDLVLSLLRENRKTIRKDK